MPVNAQKGSADRDSYGLWDEFTLSTDWVQYTASFESNVTATDARVGFNFGASTGMVWLDDVRLIAHPPDVMAREFTKVSIIYHALRITADEVVVVPSGSARDVSIDGRPYVFAGMLSTSTGVRRESCYDGATLSGTVAWVLAQRQWRSTPRWRECILSRSFAKRDRSRL